MNIYDVGAGYGMKGAQIGICGACGEDLKLSRPKRKKKNVAGSVRTTLKLYLAWLDDPSKAHFDGTARKPKAKPAAPTTEELPLAAPTATTAATPATTTTAVQRVAPQAELRSYPVGDGRVVMVGFPENFTVRDLAKFSCFAATHCVDFDPTKPNEGTIVAMARKHEPKS